MEHFERLAERAVEADLKAQEMLRNQEQQTSPNASAGAFQEADAVHQLGNGERHIIRVHYYSIPQIVHKEYVQMGSMWCAKKKVKIAWEGPCKRYKKIIVARNEEQARSMLQDGAEEDRSSEFRMRRKYFVNQFDRRSFNQVIVEITKWEVLI
jgi:hypothetical protein